jgi:hypothetical protein
MSKQSIIKTKEQLEKQKDKISLQDVIKKIPEYLGPGLKYILMISICVFIGFVLYTTVGSKPDVVYLRKYVYIMTILLPLLLLVYLFVRKDSSRIDPNIIMTVGGVIVFITITILLAYYKKPGSSSSSSIIMQTYIINLILLAIVIVALAIGYNVLKNSAKRMRGWPGFIVNFLFFIPCLLSDFVDYMLSEFKQAPPSVFILFIIEIILILAYIYVPKILKMLIVKNGVSLQYNPVYLNRVKILSNSDIFLLPNSVTSTLSLDVSSNTYNSNFGLSMWIYVNNMGTSKLQENGSNLFRNSSPNNANGKPSINFMGGKDEWKFTFTDQLIKYNIIEDKDDISTFLNKNGTIYKEWSDTENSLSDSGYSIKYTYSYGINNFYDTVKHLNTDTYSSISAVLTSIDTDYQNYKVIADQHVREAIDANMLTNKDAEYLTLNDMYSLVTKITQTIKYNGDNSVRLTVPSQKWNHIVFNYYENTVDLFINGNLERSMNLKNSPIHFLPTDVISVGDVNGIHGSICNLVYYTEPLTKTKISHIYNTNFMKNPPV